MVFFSDVVESAIITARAEGAVFFGDHMKRRRPWAGGFLAYALHLEVSEDFLGGVEFGRGEAAEFGVYWRSSCLDVVLDAVKFFSEFR